MELVCPAGTPASLRAAVDAGADVVYGGFRDDTNARNFPGLNFSREEMADGIAYAHARGCKVYIAINTFPRAGDLGPWQRAVDDAAGLGADAVILADAGLLDHAARRHPALRRHLSVQAAAASAQAVRFYQDAFGIARVVLPRVLTLADIRELVAATGVETEVFAFGGMCPMAEGRCSLSSYATGRSPNMDGVCSPASHVRYEERADGLVSRLGAFTIDVLEPDVAAGYPTLCKGRFVADGVTGHLFEEPVSLSVGEMLGELRSAGVSALKIEGRQRGRAYVAQVVRAWRRMLDGRPVDAASQLRALAEGGRDTTGAYRRGWR
jgi:O2-independent ubiquinone biosynthesis protein UbiU